MQTHELIERFAQRGAVITEAEIIERFGSAEFIGEADIDTLVAEISGGGSSRKTRSGNLVKSTPSVAEPAAGQITKVDANNLPEVGKLSRAELGQWVQTIESLPARRRQGRKMGEFLAQVYSAIAAMDSGDRAILSALEQQNSQVAATTRAMGDLLGQIAQEAEQRVAFVGQLERFTSAFCQGEGELSGVELFNSLITKGDERRAKSEV